MHRGGDSFLRHSASSSPNVLSSTMICGSPQLPVLKFEPYDCFLILFWTNPRLKIRTKIFLLYFESKTIFISIAIFSYKCNNFKIKIYTYAFARFLFFLNKWHGGILCHWYASFVNIEGENIVFIFNVPHFTFFSHSTFASVVHCGVFRLLKTDCANMHMHHVLGINVASRYSLSF